MYEERNITSDRVINQSTNTVTDARLGPGVALTERETVCTQKYENATPVL